MKLYLISSSHLDTSWEWTLETTVKKYLPRTFSDNYKLIDKYPHFKFNWEGAYRYELLEEYYPELFKKLKKYVKGGRWAPVGASYENGDVNQPSPEALFRNILYGQTFFREKLGTVSNDIFLPDCFGFGLALPSIARHAGLRGFISQKLSFGSAYGYPFDLGIWYGSDGNSIPASLMPGVYSLHIEKLRDLRKDKFNLDKLNNIKKYGLDFTNRFFGVGDKGMGVAPETAEFVENEIKKNKDSDIEIECVTSTEFFDIFDSLDEKTKARLPVWKTELPLSSHGVGGYTSRTPSSRWNKAAQRIADSAERACVFAAAAGEKYPQKALDTAWKRVIAHQFHDDITGTSLMVCYLRNWNDYLMSLSQFSEEYRRAVGVIASEMKTDFVKEGDLAVAVFDPMIRNGNAKRTIRVDLPEKTDCATVYGNDGKALPAQVDSENGRYVLSFTAPIPSLGVNIYGIKTGAAGYKKATAVTATGNSLENEFIKVKINKDGDVCSIIDKKTGRETLRSPIRHAVFDYTGAKEYPAWELRYDELCARPAGYAKKTESEIIRNGPSSCSIRTVKKYRDSVITETVTLNASSRTLDFECEADWREERSLMKAVFDGKAENEKAVYDLGLGIIERETNTAQVYECAAQTWADITDKSGGFGFSVLSDSKTGWDKPDAHTLRLTIVHTPKEPDNPGQAQNLLDLGLLRYSFSVYPHEGGWQNGTQREADLYEHPVYAVYTGKHPGKLSSRSLARITGGALVRCLKKEHRGEGTVIRVNEPNGRKVREVRFSMEGGIRSAYEANAVEEKIGGARVENGELVFSLKPFEVKTFVLTPKRKPEKKVSKQRYIPLPCNIRAITNRGEKSTLRYTVPAELIGREVVSGGIKFKISGEEKNAMSCRGQAVNIPRGRVSLLCASAGKPKKLKTKDKTFIIPAAADRYGSWDMIGLAHTGEINPSNILAFNATHAHDRRGNIAVLKDLAFYKITFDWDGGEFRFPDNKDIIILAATAEVNGAETDARPVKDPFDRLEKRECDYTISYGAFKKIRRIRRPAKGNLHRDSAGRMRVDVCDLMIDNKKYDRGRDGLHN